MTKETHSPESNLRWAQLNADRERDTAALLVNIKKELPQLRALLEEVSNEWGYEDPWYRLYHQSFKVYGAQETTLKIVRALTGLSARPLNEWFVEIIKSGTGKQFEVAHNEEWLAHTRPIIEAFAHARFFLEMTVKYGADLDAPVDLLPSGWAAVLYLYGLR